MIARRFHLLHQLPEAFDRRFVAAIRRRERKSDFHVDLPFRARATGAPQDPAFGQRTWQKVSVRSAQRPFIRFGSQRASSGNVISRAMTITMPSMKGSTPIHKSIMVPASMPASLETDLRMP
jgi:hypothetical protein